MQHTTRASFFWHKKKQQAVPWGIVAALLWGCAGLARAADDPEKLFFAEMPMVLTASRLPQPLADSPGAVTVIDRELIRATGYRNIPDLLRLVPGFNVAWLRGWWGVVNYHGLSGEFSNRVLVRIDDRPVNSEYWIGGIDWTSLPIDVDDIERIEVLRGSNSTSFGTNAFLGVINIRTRTPDAEDAGSVRLSGGAGVRDGVLRTNFAAGDVSGRLTLGHRADTGLDRLQDSSNNNFLNLALELNRESDSYRVALGGLKSVAGEGFATQAFDPLRNRHSDTGFVQASWTRRIAPENELTLHGYHNRERYIDEVTVTLPPPYPPAPIVSDQNRIATRTGLEFKQAVRLGANLRTAWGVDASFETLSSPIFFGSNQPKTRQTRRAFGQLEWRVDPRLLINAGTMVENVSAVGTRVSPRLFANYEVAQGHVLRAGYSTATRAPNLFESFAYQVTTPSGVPLEQTIVGNAALVPERIHATEVGYYGHSADQRYEADVRIYRESLSKLIVQVNADSVPPPGTADSNFTYANLDSAVLTGISYQIKARPWPGTQFLFGHEMEHIRNNNPRVQQSAPPNSFSFGWIQEFDKHWSTTLLYYRVGTIEWLEFGERIAPYQRTDMRVSHRFKWGRQQGELSLVGLNLFGSYHEFRNGNPGEDQAFSRRVFTTVRLDF